VVVDNYRTAHDIAQRHGRGEASTEDLRQAMVHFRTLFDELTADPATAPAPAPRADARVEAFERDSTRAGRAQAARS
jgi:hypothetical protein